MKSASFSTVAPRWPGDDGAMSMIATEGAAAPPATPRSPLAGEAFRYLAASVAALALDAGLLAVGVRALALEPWTAGAVSYAAGLVFIYVVSIRWVFAERAVRDSKSEFAVFALLGIVGLLLNSATLYVATTAGLALPVAKALSAGIGFVANFVSRKALLFSAGRRGARR
jgi:putative flippase GtrA